MTLPSESLFIIAAAAALLFMILWMMSFRKSKRLGWLLHQREIELAASAHYAETIAALKDALAAESEAKSEAEKSAIIARERAEERAAQLETRLKDWEAQKVESINMARAAVAQLGQEMSSKLLEDHKREAAEAKKLRDAEADARGKALIEQFDKLTHSVTAIQTREAQSSKQMQAVMRALTNPGGAGYQSETILENSLKNLGLEAGRDFITQFHFMGSEGRAMRPDAVVFLPQDMVMVIDSKSSKFIIELGEATSAEEEERLLQQFVQSMNQHIRALSQKQYADEVSRILRLQGRSMGQMFNVMYLPSETAIERLVKADGTFRESCEKARLLIAGPTSLAGLFLLANQQIAAAKRDANQEQIIAQLRELMANFAGALDHIGTVGKHIRGAAEKYDTLARSLNKNVLPKLRKMQMLGVEPAKGKALPHAIKSFDVIDRDEIVDVQADEEPLLQLESA